jgi:antitoxin (DNA-binding transcriptional repressor) of toxin-antitoxin stability system
MKVIEKVDATSTLAEYTAKIADGPVIVTSEGTPVAALVPIQNADLETVSLSNNSTFLDLIARSRARFQIEGGITSDEMRRRFE